MGFVPYPYCAVQGMNAAEEIILGNKNSEINPFRWSKVILNLLFLASYDTSRPWVFKVRIYGKIASNIFSYTDDQRVGANSGWECWLMLQWNRKHLSYLGAQAASRKGRPVGTAIGAWAGSMIRTSDEQVMGMILEEKWSKMRDILLQIKHELEAVYKIDPTKPMLDFKQLKRDRGFLVYTLRCYTGIYPYLKGLHAAIYVWRKNQDSEG